MNLSSTGSVVILLALKSMWISRKNEISRKNIVELKILSNFFMNEDYISKLLDKQTKF